MRSLNLLTRETKLGINEITTETSITAKPFRERMGYQVVKQQLKEVKKDKKELKEEREERNTKLAHGKVKAAKYDQKEIRSDRKNLNATKKKLKREGVEKPVSKATGKPSINN